MVFHLKVAGSWGGWTMTAWSTAVTVNQLVTATSGQLGPRVVAMAGGCNARQDDAATTLASRGCWKGFSLNQVFFAPARRNQPVDVLVGEEWSKWWDPELHPRPAPPLLLLLLQHLASARWPCWPVGGSRWSQRWERLLERDQGAEEGWPGGELEVGEGAREEDGGGGSRGEDGQAQGETLSQWRQVAWTNKIYIVFTFASVELTWQLKLFCKSSEEGHQLSWFPTVVTLLGFQLFVKCSIQGPWEWHHLV